MADKLQRGAVRGEVIVWREIMTEGAISENLADPGFLNQRAASLQNILGIPPESFMRNVRLQETRLERAVVDKDIVLWFEHDLFDQTILWYLLHRLEQLRADPERVFLLSIGEYPGIEPFFGMGQLSTDQLKKLSGTWRPITPEDLTLGSRAWKAYASDNPLALQHLLHEDTSNLPHLSEAVKLHLSRFPSVHHGLGAVEHITLETLASKEEQPEALFRLVSHQVPHYGMGDLQFWGLLRDLYQSSPPLIDSSHNPFPDFLHSMTDFRHAAVRMTETGRAVLGGKLDRIRTCGVHQWLGGVLLQGKTVPWRWDPDNGRIIKA